MLDLGPFAGTGHENWIGVVDVRIDFSTRRRMTQEIKAAIADRDMIHFSPAKGAWPNSPEFVVAPECTVEQNKVRTVNGVAQLVCDFTDSGRDERGNSRDFIAQLQRNALAQFNRAKTDAVAQRLEIAGCRSPFNSAERLENRVDPVKRRLCFVSRINNKRRCPLPHEKQPKAMIQIGISEKNACDWAVSQPRMLSERLQFRSAFYLSRQVR